MATILASAGTLGAAAAVGAATAVALGGAGAIAWVWLFGLLLAPLRYAETVLGRTAPPGQAGEERSSASLSARLLRDPCRLRRGLGWALAAALVAAAFLFVGGTHGGGLRALATRVYPEGAPWILVAVALAGGLLAAAGARRAGRPAGWIALGALGALGLLALWAAMTEPGRAFGTLFRALEEAIEGAPDVGAFTGAFAGEITFAALTSALPSVGAGVGLTGALAATARAKSTRAQAAASMLEPLLFAGLVTLLGASFVATGAYFELDEDERPIDALRVYTRAPETASQRAEEDRLYSGYMRLVEGEPRMVHLGVGTSRGPVRRARYVMGGEPADVALHLEAGRPFRLLGLGQLGALEELPPERISELRVRGRMLPEGPGLLAASAARGVSEPWGPRATLVCLMLLLAAAAAAWGFALRRLLPGDPDTPGRRALALLPALGLALAAFGPAWLSPLGSAAAALSCVVGCLALLSRAKQAAQLGG